MGKNKEIGSFNQISSERDKRTWRQSNVSTGEKSGKKTRKKTAFEFWRCSENRFYSYKNPVQNT